MEKQEKLQKKAEMKRCLVDIMYKINAHFVGEFEAEILDNGMFFPNGLISICDEHMRINVAFYLGASAERIGGMALVLSEYKDQLAFENLPVFFSKGKIFEGDEAIIEYGKSLLGSVAYAEGILEADDDKGETIQVAKVNKETLQ